MALPYPSMSFSPFEILTAQEMNNLVSNIQSLSTLTGLNAGTSRGTLVSDSSGNVTVKSPRSINITLNTSTGMQSITGVGFRARAALTQSMGSANVLFSANGSATDMGGTIDQGCTAIRSEGSAGTQTLYEGQSFLHVTGGGSGLLRAVITEFTADGFNINITTMGTTSTGPRQWRVTLFP